jgi:hypothetical protein
MKFSKETLKVLDNFSKVNPSLYFLKGTKQKTWMAQGTFMAIAEIEEDLPQEFGIYKLGQFLSLISLFDDPEITFEEKHLEISEGDSKINYYYSSANTIDSPPKDKDPVLRNDVAVFRLTEDKLDTLLSTSRVMSLQNLVISSEDSKIQLSLENKEERSKAKDSFVVSIKSDEEIEDFSIDLDLKILTVVSDDYDVTVYKNVVKLEAVNKNIKYLIPLEVKND